MAEKRNIYAHPNNSSAVLSDATDVPLRTIESGEAAKTATDEPQRTVGLQGGVITIVSLMIGSGIFASSGMIHKYTGSIGLTLIIWLATGCIALCGALCYAELGTAIPGSGGESQYLARGLGAWAAYVFEWTSIMLLRPASCSVLMVSFAKHAVFAFIALTGRPWINSVADLAEQYHWTCKIIAIVGCLLITASASISTKASDQIQGVLTYGKIASLAVISLAGLGMIAYDRTIIAANFSAPFTSSYPAATWQKTLGGIALAMNNGLWAYDGWNNLNMIAGKIKNPARTLPLSIWTSILTVVGMYMFVLLGYYAVVPSDVIMQSQTVGVEFGRRLFENETMKWVGASIMSVFVMASTFGAALSSMNTSSEVIIQAAQKGHLPAFFGQLNAGTGTAVRAYTQQCVIAVLAVFFAEFDDLMTICAFPTWIFYTMAIVTLLLLRLREPELPRPYKVWASTPVIYLAACIFLIITSMITEFSVTAVSIGVTALGIPLYFLLARSRNKK